MYKYVIFISIVFIVSQSVFGQSCANDIYSSFNGNQNNTIEVTVYDLTGTTVLGTIDCPISNNGGNNYNVNCDLSSYGNDVVYVFEVCNGSGNNCLDCYYDADGNNIAPLPVELVDFSLTKNGVFNKISWATSTETNNSHFTIEYSRNGFDFEPVRTVPGAGNSFSHRGYEVSHRPMIQGDQIVYYRLSQTDFDGTNVHLGIKAIQYNFTEAVAVYSHDGNIVFADLTENPIELIQVLDYTGRVVESISLPSDNSFVFSLPKNSIYIIHTVYEDGGHHSVKINH